MMLNTIATIMLRSAPPGLPKRLHEPPGFVWGRFTADDGAVLRWGQLSPLGAAADCVLVGGFCEIVEKYFELMHDLAARGVAVWCLDWRGQGGSQRPAERPKRPRARDFAGDRADLAAFTRAVSAPQRPRLLVAHSMGAAIGLQTLADHPGLFDAAVLCAPMIAPATRGLPPWLAAAVARAVSAVGASEALIPGSSILRLDGVVTPERSATSSDPVRCGLLAAWFKARPDLAVDGATFGWYRGALDFSRSFKRRERFARIATPILMGLAGDDLFVDTAVARRLAGWLPHCEIVEFADAKHELFHECDEIRGAWLSIIDAFLRSRLAGVSA